jgi:hypothetical protein
METRARSARRLHHGSHDRPRETVLHQAGADVRALVESGAQLSLNFE